MTDEPAGSCACCRRRDPRYGQTCDACRSRLAAWLTELPDLHADLTDLQHGHVGDHHGEPGHTVNDRRTGTRAAISRDVQGRRLIVREPGHPADPVAHHLPPGPINGPAHGGKVSGSRVPPVPIRIDPTDLIGPARQIHLTDLHARYGSRYPEHHEDQVGHVSVAGLLDGWVRDWREYRAAGEGLPPQPTVAVLAGWLADRLTWACDEHPAIAEFRDEVATVRSVLCGHLGLFDVPDYKRGVPCRECGMLTLVRVNGSDYVECGTCPSLLSPDEYERWTGLLAAEAKQRTKGDAA